MRKVIATIVSICLTATVSWAQHVAPPSIVPDGPTDNPVASGCLPTGTGMVRGNGSNGCTPAQPNADFVPPTGPATSTSALVNDTNNHQTLSAAGAQQGSPDIPEIRAGSDSNVHVGGMGANGINLDSAATQNQGQFTSGAYGNTPINDSGYGGGDETCAQDVHTYKLISNATIRLVCPLTAQHRTLTYYFIQPASGSTFTFNFTTANGAKILGDAPVACSPLGCIDWVTVTWIPSENTYIVNLVKGNMTGGSGGGGSACPVGQVCYYVASASDTPAGNDGNNGLSPSTPWLTTGKVLTILSTLNPGDRVLFHSASIWNLDTSLPNAGAGNNPMFRFGDIAAHNISGSAAKPIFITTYGGGANAIFNGGNKAGVCFGAYNPSGSVNYLTISGFDCHNVFAMGISFKDSTSADSGAGANEQGITISNNNIYDTGPGCSHWTGLCANGQDGWDNWVAGSVYITYTSCNNSNTNRSCGYLQPTANNAGKYVFRVTTGCTESGSAPSFSQTPGSANAADPAGCVFQNTGIQSGAVPATYENQLNAEDDAGYAHSFHIISNSVKWCGGHNCLQVHFDTGQSIVQGNTVGPGCTHNCLDEKGTGNYNAAGSTGIAGMVFPGNVAQVIQNTVDCGTSLSACNIGGTDANDYFIQNTGPPAGGSGRNAVSILYQSNTAYDSALGFNAIPNGNGCNDVAHGAPAETECPIVVRAWNNTAYGPALAVGSGGFNASIGSGPGSPATCPSCRYSMQNDIADGFAKAVQISGFSGTSVIGGVTTREDYNDIGGAQGFSTFSFNGSAVKGTHDLTNVDPSYICELDSSCISGSPPNFSLQAGSPVIGKGNVNLTQGNFNIGRY